MTPGLRQDIHATNPGFSAATIGIVTNNRDPENLGRVKVEIPRISMEHESAWARVVTFMAGAGRGGFFLPEIEDEVLVLFEHGDVNHPYIIGSLWNGVDLPPEKNADGKNNSRLIKTRSGHLLKFDDTAGGEKIEIVEKSGKNKIQIDTSKDAISIVAGKALQITCENGKISLSAAEITIKAEKNLKIECAAGIDVTAKGNLNLKGKNINLN